MPCRDDLARNDPLLPGSENRSVMDENQGMDDLGTTIQYVYLDFDGERTTYRNRDLNVSLSVSVQNPGFSEAQKQEILSELTAQYKDDGVVFTTEKPKDSAYSTLFFGQSSAFRKYGDFYGVSETIDGNNQVNNDRAFILLNSTYSTDQVISVAARELDNLLGNSITVSRKKELKDYAASTYLLSTEWNQTEPYNQYCPIDPATGKRSITGCTNTAAAQIIYYWIKTGYLDFSLVIDALDSYTENGITISDSSGDVSKYGYLSFKETNKLLSNFSLDNTSSIAALCFAAGIVQQASYSSESTATPWGTSLFTRSGFENNVRDYYSSPWYFKRNQGGLTDSGCNLVISELLNGRPVGASLVYGDGKENGELRHAVVIDGYDSAKNEFHLNFGWGGKNNGWYSLDALNSDYVIDELVVGIVPVVSPCLTVSKMSFAADTVNWDADVKLSFSILNTGTEKSAATTAYIYCGEKLLDSVAVDFVSAGCSRSFTCTIKASLLPVGSCSLTVNVMSQDSSGSVSSLSRTLKVFDEAVTDADDTWSLANTAGDWTKTTLEYDSEGHVADTVLASDEYVGYYDHVDFREITLEHAGKYTFTLHDIEKNLEIKVYSLTEKNSLKELKSCVVSGSKGGGQLADVPIEKGTCYVSVRAVNWSSHADSKYTLSVSGEGFMKANDQDDWADLKNGSDESIPFAGGISGQTTDVITNEWVGLGDEIDYRKISLQKAAKLSFTLAATDGVKFTISRLVRNTGKNGVVTGSLKNLQTTELKKNNKFTAQTAPLLLEAGDYYVSVLSTNAAKGGSADYSVRLNEAGCKFYDDGDDGWNNWLYDTKTKKTNAAVCGEDVEAVSLGRNGRYDVSPDGKAASPEGWDNFVGFGDDTDYVMIRLETAANLSFSISALDSVKLMIVQFVCNKNGEVTGTKTLQTTSTKYDKTSELHVATSKLKLLETGGVYYLAVQSTNAKKGGDAYYNLTVNEASVFFDNFDDGWNNWLFEKKKGGVNTAVTSSPAETICASAVGKFIQMDDTKLEVTVKDTVFHNFVGFDDEFDYRMIHAKPGSAVFTVQATDAAKFMICQYVRNKKGEITGTKVLQTTVLKQDKSMGLYSGTSAKPCQFKEEDDYFLAVQSTNAKKGGNAYYNVTLFDTDIADETADVFDSAGAGIVNGGFDLVDELNSNLGRMGDDVLATAGAYGFADASLSGDGDLEPAWRNIASLA